MNKPFNPELIDADNPEWTPEMFANAKRGTAAARVGRPPVTNPKVFTGIRLSPEVLQAFKMTGKGWQTRIDNALKEWLADHPSMPN